MTNINSPQTILSRNLTDTLDIVSPRIKINNPEKIVLSVGTQINGVPHVGTYLTICASFVMAKQIAEKYKIPVSIEYIGLDNVPNDTLNGNNGQSYQRSLSNAVSIEELNTLMSEYYKDFLEGLHETTGIDYSFKMYSDVQASKEFRSVFLKTLKHSEEIGACVGPSYNRLWYRIACPQCGYAEKYGESTKVLEVKDDSATFQCVCMNHGTYETTIGGENDEGAYLDLNTLYRNVVKEAMAAGDHKNLYVMVKGADWAVSTQLVDWALGVLGYKSIEVPMRIFTPQIVTETGAKLSKSLIRDGDKSMDNVPEWILDMNKLKEKLPNTYVKDMVALVEKFVSDPKHMYRSYSYQEIARLLDIELEPNNEKKLPKLPRA